MIGSTGMDIREDALTDGAGVDGNDDEDAGTADDGTFSLNDLLKEDRQWTAASMLLPMLSATLISALSSAVLASYDETR